MRTMGRRCDMCGAWFLLRETLERHRAQEIPGFRAVSAAKNEAYAERRRLYRIDHPDRRRGQ